MSNGAAAKPSEPGKFTKALSDALEVQEVSLLIRDQLEQISRDVLGTSPNPPSPNIVEKVEPVDANGILEQLLEYLAATQEFHRQTTNIIADLKNELA